MSELSRAVDIQLGRLGDVKTVTVREAYGVNKGRILVQHVLSPDEAYSDGIKLAIEKLTSWDTDKTGK